MDSKAEPLVSVVTPSYNMGRFLEETIQSVLSQDYPRIEYLVMDGGSSDGTLDLLRKFAGRLQYVSAPDGGQADAVNRGFRRTSGAVFAFLNADDTYLPGAISTAVKQLRDHPEIGIVYGQAWHVAEDGTILSRYPAEPFDRERLRRRCFICQPASFMRRAVFAESGMLNPRLRFALDYDFWIRAARLTAMRMIDDYLATSRLHRGNKTLGSLRQVFREVFSVLRRHYGYVPCNWLYGYSDYLLSGREPVLEQPRPALSSAALCALLAAYYNWRHPVRLMNDLYSTAREGLACSIPT